MQKKDGGNWTDEQYRNAVAGLTAPLIVIEILFLVVAVLLFATQKERWWYGFVFVGLGAVLAAIYFIIRAVLKKKISGGKSNGRVSKK